MRVKLPFSTISLPLALPFIAVVIYEAYLIVGVYTGVLGPINTKGFPTFMAATQPWRSILGPVFSKLTVLMGAKNGIPVYLFWLVCTAINAFLVFLIGTLVNLKIVSKAGAVFACGYIMACLYAWTLADESVNKLSYSGEMLNFLASPFGLFMSSLLGKLGVVLAMIFNSALAYCIGSFSGKMATAIKQQLAPRNEFTPGG